MAGTSEASRGDDGVTDDEKSFNEYINEAEEKMYAHKKARKAERQEIKSLEFQLWGFLSVLARWGCFFHPYMVR